MILMAGWVWEARHPTPCVRSHSAEADDLRHTAASLAIEACAQLEADPSTPRSPRPSTYTATSCPEWPRRSPRKWMGSDGPSRRRESLGTQ
jgi:hypothetical protein